MKKGICYILIASLFFTFQSAFVKEIGDNSSTVVILFARFSINLLLMIPIIIKDKDFSFKVKRPSILLLRCIFGLIGLALFYYALNYIPLANAILLQNTRPLFIPIILLVFLKKKTVKMVILGIIISFIGIAIIINPGGKGAFQSVALLALLSGFFTAVVAVLLRMFIRGNNQGKTNEALFYYALFGTVVMTIILPFFWKTPSFYIILLLIGVGVFGMLFQLFMTVSYKYLSVAISTPMMYAAVIFGGILDWLVWNDKITWPFVIGMIIVFVGTFFVVYFSPVSNAGKTESQPQK